MRRSGPDRQAEAESGALPNGPVIVKQRAVSLPCFNDLAGTSIILELTTSCEVNPISVSSPPASKTGSVGSPAAGVASAWPWQDP
jgi:hypothetical protein